LLLFGSAFNRVITFPSYSYIAFMTSGVVVMTTFNGALYGGVEILFDRESKLIYRLISSPIHPSSTIASRILFVLAITSLQSLIVLAVASAVNLRISSGVLGLVLILLLDAWRSYNFNFYGLGFWYEGPWYIFLFVKLH
jgi:ABC-2 type transporter.